MPLTFVSSSSFSALCFVYISIIRIRIVLAADGRILSTEGYNFLRKAIKMALVTRVKDNWQITAKYTRPSVKGCL